MTPEKINSIISAFHAGVPLRAIQGQFGVNWSYLSVIIGNLTRPKLKRQCKYSETAIWFMYFLVKSSGNSYSAQEWFGISKSRVYKIIKKHKKTVDK